MPKSSEEFVINEVLCEKHSAEIKFPQWPTDILHAVAIINEEVGELNKSILQFVYEPSKNSHGFRSVKKEAVQSAAMCFRFLEYIWYYESEPSEMFK